MKIKNFFMTIILIFIFFISALTYIQYKIQQEEYYKLIYLNLSEEVLNTKYNFNNFHYSNINFSKLKNYLNMKKNTNKFISDIQIVENINIKNKNFIEIPIKNNFYMNLQNNQGINFNIKTISNKNKINILIFFNHKNIENNFYMIISRYVFFLLFFPLLFITIIFILIEKYILKYLNKISHVIDNKFEKEEIYPIEELEIIKNTLLINFEYLKNEKEEINKLLNVDILSGLGNKKALEENFKYISAEANRTHKNFALIFLDLDNFKNINDSLGHEIGDEVLKIISKDIKDHLRKNDIASRIGGDEFVLIISDYSDERNLISLIKRIQEKIREEKKLKEHKIKIDSSVGISIYPVDGTDLSTLMKNADIALYKSKEDGKAQFSFFTSELNIKTQKYIELTNEMKKSINDNHFQLYYQPQVDIKTGKIIGAEALIRWIHPELGFISPIEFIPIAEHNGFIKELGEWILNEAFYHKNILENMKFNNITLSINVAPSQMNDIGFYDNVEKSIKKYNIDPRGIILEITESTFIKKEKEIKEIFIKLKELGIKMSLDDFGTGYSSLSYLKKYPMDKLKIDKSFVDEYDTKSGYMFLETIIKMADILNLEVIAEGVEIKEQLELLSKWDCEIYQGYYFSKPLPFNDFVNILKGNKND